jgi:hypothetical protein
MSEEKTRLEPRIEQAHGYANKLMEYCFDETFTDKDCKVDFGNDDEESTWYVQVWVAIPAEKRKELDEG